MAERDDRGIPGSGTVIAVAVVIVLLASSGLVLWWKLKAGAPSGDAAGGDARLPAVSRPLDTAMPLTVFLPAADALAASSVPVKAQLDAQSQAREVIAAVLSEERRDRGPVLPGVQLREVYLDASGTAYLDLSVVPAEGIRSSAWDEMLAVAALATSVMQNVAEVRQVRFLVDGREVSSLSGHVDLTRSYTRRMDLVK